MILVVEIDNDISSNYDLLIQFDKNYYADINIIIDNSSKPLQKMISKNSSILTLIEKLDLVEV